jgi:preprotein translocase subunit SecE
MSSESEASQQANRTGMDPVRLVLGFYLVAGLVLALFLGHIISILWGRFGWPNQELIAGTAFDIPTVVGFVLAVAAVVFAWVNPAAKGRAMESASELLKVTWPSWGETRVSTVAVVIASLVAAVILFGIDTLSYQVMVDWLPRVWASLQG